MKERLQNKWVRRSLYVAGALFVFGLGVAVGIMADDQSDRIAALEDKIATIERDRDLAEAHRDDVLDQLSDTRAELRAARGAASRAQRGARRAAGRAQRDRAAGARKHAPGDDSAGPDGTYTVGQFSISDVQVREDSVGDFEVRARVTNNGGAAELVLLVATLFNEDSVVGIADTYEDFDAGQTRTVTLTASDDYGAWDDVEFTIEVGL